MKAETSPQRDFNASTRPVIRRIEAVVNEAGGSVGSGAAAELQTTVDSFGIPIRVTSVGPHDIETAVRAAVSSAPDLIITLAGDGTARLAAELCGTDGPLLAPLAGGTMNMLPYALYGKRHWSEALKAALTDGATRRVPGGLVDGRPFYVAAILGAPALWAPAREAVRHRKLKLALLRARYALSRAFTGKLRLRLDDGLPMKAEALALLSPLISTACTNEESLEAIVLDPRHAADAIRIGGRAMVGEWRNDPAVNAQFCVSGRVLARHSIPCLLDGEMQNLGRMAKIDFRSNMFRALTPAPLPSESCQAAEKTEIETS